MKDRMLLNREMNRGGFIVGKLSIPGVAKTFLTIETEVSALPVGEYILQLRQSRKVEAASSNEYDEGWEVIELQTTNTSKVRNMIMPGNRPQDLRGSIGLATGVTFESGFVGTNQSGLSGKSPSRLVSMEAREAFKRFMEESYNKAQWFLIVEHNYEH